MQFTVESVQNVLHSFYGSSSDPHGMAMAQEWLIQFQKSNSVWQIAPLLLQNNIVEIQYFGASTIEAKIKSDWTNMSAELKQQVLEQLLLLLRSDSSNLQKVVVTRLCLAVAAIACHSTSDTWQNPIQDILQLIFPEIDTTDTDAYLRKYNPNTTLSSGSSSKIVMVLELLTILPDELLNCDYITQERRNRVGSEFNKSTEAITKVISKFIHAGASISVPTAQSTATLKSALKCFKSWVLFDTPATYFLVGPLLSDCFDAVVKDPQLVEEFVLVLDEIFTFMRGKHFKQYPSSFSPIVARILDVLPHYYLMAQQEFNERIYISIFLLLSHIPETHAKLLLASEHNERFMSVLVGLAMHGGTEICDLMEPVISEVHTLFDSSVDITVWKPFLCETIELLRTTCMFPEDEMDSLEHENFLRFRGSSGDSLLNIYSILESKVLQILLSSLWNDINKFPNTTWQSIEATVFLLGCLSEGITDDISFIPQLFQLLGSLPIQSTPLVKSTIVLAGKYANLLEKSTQFLIKLVGDFIPAFSNPELCNVASDSFLSIARNKNCALLLSTDISTLAKVCEPIISQDNESSRKILEALMEIVAVLPPEDTLNYISKLISPYLNFLKQYQPNSKTSQATLLNTISILSKLFKTFEFEEYEISQEKDTKFIHPVLPIALAVIPITGNILKLQQDIEIVDQISLLYKRIAISCSKNYDQFISTIFMHMTEIYEINPLNQSLNTMSLGLPSLSHNQRYEFLTHSINSVSSTTFQIWKNGNADRVGVIHTPSLYNLSIIPSITKEYFSLLEQCIKYNIISFPINLLMPLFQVILENILNIQDKPTIRPLCSFMSTLISVEQKGNHPNYINFKSELDRLLGIHGESLIKQVLYAVGGGAPRSIAIYIANIINSLIVCHPNTFRPIALRMLSVDGFPSSYISLTQKEKFLENIMRYKSKQTTFRKTIEEFSIVCKGFTNR